MVSEKQTERITDFYEPDDDPARQVSAMKEVATCEHSCDQTAEHSYMEPVFLATKNADYTVNKLMSSNSSSALCLPCTKRET